MALCCNPGFRTEKSGVAESTLNIKNPYFNYYYRYIMGPGSPVGIATGYGLDGPGIESLWGRDFSNTSRPALEPTQPPVQRVPGLSRG
jgi:hypothetical protein